MGKRRKSESWKEGGNQGGELTGDWASVWFVECVCVFGEDLLQLTSSCSGPRMRVPTNNNSNTNNKNNNNNSSIDNVQALTTTNGNDNVGRV